MFWCRFSLFTSSWRFCTTPWPSRPCVPLHSAPEIYWIQRKTLSLFVIHWLRYSWGVQWVASGTWTAAWSRRDTSWLMQGKGIYQVYTDSILVIWRLHSYPYWIFPQNSQKFPLNSQNFPQTHKCTLEYSSPIRQSSQIRRLKRWTEDYPILETFLFFITELRFGGVGAPEGPQERVSLFIQKSSAK